MRGIIQDWFSDWSDAHEDKNFWEYAATQAMEKAAEHWAKDSITDEPIVDLGTAINDYATEFGGVLLDELGAIPEEWAQKFYNEHPRTSAAVAIPLALAAGFIFDGYLRAGLSDASASVDLADLLGDDFLTWEFTCGNYGRSKLSIELPVKLEWASGSSILKPDFEYGAMLRFDACWGDW